MATLIPATYRERLDRLRAEMLKRKLGAYLVLDRMEQIWLTGFSGEDGGVLVTHKGVILITDGRFAEGADLEAPWAKRVLRTKRGPDSYAKVIKQSQAGRIGFEPSHMNVYLFSEISKLVKPARLHSAAGIIQTMRLCKTPDEVAAIRRALDIAQRAFATVREEIRPGVTESHIAARLNFEMLALGAQGPSFETIVAAGANASRPHYEPSRREVRAGEGVLVDWGARCDWYVSDLTRVVWTGSIPPSLGKAYDAVREAHDRAIAAVKPGVKASAVDKVARGFLEKAGFGKQFGHSLGHGIGLNIHEGPRVAKTSSEVLQPGMVVTIEPGVYMPGVGGVRLEDDVLVTETGYEVLSSVPL